MHMIRRVLYWINMIGAVAYILICGQRLSAGHPLYHDQLQLIVQVASGLVIASLPLILERLMKRQLPDVLVALYEIFILMAILLGTGMQAYSIHYWDKVEHLFSAGILAGTGYMVFAGLTPQKYLDHISPALIGLFAAVFGISIGVFWEFYEFTGDSLLGMNMQRYMAHGQALVGQAALYDTMGDLLMDVVGSVLLGIYGFFAIRKNRRWLDTFKLRKLN
ncbi:hypothetical protein [Lacticaseibacillus hulanensis]|uniref:hypothetical protein n=1 Tax=Lacticaseibacillus hulanensis TaxID=2493111 RepID=UPI001F4E813D|nr:hypothetical protein [Lacticaseibacillus hulanensis]